VGEASHLRTWQNLSSSSPRTRGRDFRFPLDTHVVDLLSVVNDNKYAWRYAPLRFSSLTGTMRRLQRVHLGGPAKATNTASPRPQPGQV